MRGDGRIFKRGETWWAGYYVDGRQQRESCKTSDEEKARKFLCTKLKEVHAHELDPSRPFITQQIRKRTVGDLMDALETNFKLRGKDSLQNLSAIKRVKRDFGHVRAVGLTAEAVADYVRDQLATGYKKATVNRLTATLRQGYSLADMIPPKIVKLDESDNVRSGFFSGPEIRRVLTSLPANLADFTLFGWLTGMRKNEIASLRWEDVDGDCIRLRAENAKNGTSRLLPLEGELADLLVRRKAARQVKVKGIVTISALIFHRKGQPIKEFRKSWATACRLAGVAGRLFHDLRRSAVRDLVRAGVSQHVAMSISGHRSPSMFKRYNITDERDQREALRATEAYRQQQAALAEKTAAIPQQSASVQ